MTDEPTQTEQSAESEPKARLEALVMRGFEWNGSKYRDGSEYKKWTCGDINIVGYSYFHGYRREHYMVYRESTRLHQDGQPFFDLQSAIDFAAEYCA